MVLLQFQQQRGILRQPCATVFDIFYMVEWPILERTICSNMVLRPTRHSLHLRDRLLGDVGLTNFTFEFCSGFEGFLENGRCDYFWTLGTHNSLIRLQYDLVTNFAVTHNGSMGSPTTQLHSFRHLDSHPFPIFCNDCAVFFVLILSCFELSH